MNMMNDKWATGICATNDWFSFENLHFYFATRTAQPVIAFWSDIRAHINIRALLYAQRKSCIYSYSSIRMNGNGWLCDARTQPITIQNVCIIFIFFFSRLQNYNKINGLFWSLLNGCGCVPWDTFLSHEWAEWNETGKKTWKTQQQISNDEINASTYFEILALGK